jgi:hypothetical protein
MSAGWYVRSGWLAHPIMEITARKSMTRIDPLLVFVDVDIHV